MSLHKKFILLLLQTGTVFQFAHFRVCVFFKINFIIFPLVLSVAWREFKFLHHAATVMSTPGLRLTANQMAMILTSPSLVTTKGLHIMMRALLHIPHHHM